MTERSAGAAPTPGPAQVPAGIHPLPADAHPLPSFAAASPDRAGLRAHLIAGRIAGEVATPRESNLRSYRRIADRDPYGLFGLDPDGRWEYADVLALMAKRCGVVADPRHSSGTDTIDPDLTLDRLDDVADRLRQAVLRRERVLFATGHPTGMLSAYLPLARALAAAGCEVIRPAAGSAIGAPGLDEEEQTYIRYVEGVAVLARMGDLVHTHSPGPMRTILAGLADRPDPFLPDLVVGDHGWAGAAGQAGIEAVGFADCNDPGLFVGEAEGRLMAVVPLDDNVQPYLYEPLVAYLMERGDL